MRTVEKGIKEHKGCTEPMVTQRLRSRGMSRCCVAWFGRSETRPLRDNVVRPPICTHTSPMLPGTAETTCSKQCVASTGSGIQAATASNCSTHHSVLSSGPDAKCKPMWLSLAAPPHTACERQQPAAPCLLVPFHSLTSHTGSHPASHLGLSWQRRRHKQPVAAAPPPLSSNARQLMAHTLRAARGGQLTCRRACAPAAGASPSPRPPGAP